MAELELPALFVEGVAAASASRPALVNRDPGPDETDVPIDSKVALELVDPGSDGIDRTATRIWVDGILAFDGNLDPAVRPAFVGPATAVVDTADTLRVVLDPALHFASQASVVVRVVSAIIGGASVLDETYRFQIEDRTAPRVLAAQATGQRTVRVGFDEPVVLPPGGASAGFLVTPLETPAVPIAAAGAAVDTAIVELTLDTEMTPDVHYEVRATGVTDLAGNPVLAPFDRTTFAGFRPSRPASRCFDLWQMLPSHNRRIDQTGDLRRFIACLQEVTDLLLADCDRFPDVFDLERAPEPFLDAILTDLGNPFPFDLNALGKRRLAAILVQMYRQKGTAVGIRNAIRFFLGIEVEAITPFAGNTLVLDESQLGVDWELGPSDRFARYAFDVRVGVPLTDTQRRQIRTVVNYLRPAHAHFLTLIEPSTPPTPAHWELGISELSASSFLH
ncbi:MAG: Ig-like domain-containing protein [Pseudomonadota bacterium]